MFRIVVDLLRPRLLSDELSLLFTDITDIESECFAFALESLKHCNQGLVFPLILFSSDPNTFAAPMGMKNEMITRLAFGSRIFDLYYSTKATGTGVGLALTQKIVADHQGTIEVTSTLRKGTHFEIRIPVEQ
jgi:hypothetical protein